MGSSLIFSQFVGAGQDPSCFLDKLANSQETQQIFQSVPKSRQEQFGAED